MLLRSEGVVDLKQRQKDLQEKDQQSRRKLKDQLQNLIFFMCFAFVMMAGVMVWWYVAVPEKNKKK